MMVVVVLKITSNVTNTICDTKRTSECIILKLNKFHSSDNDLFNTSWVASRLKVWAKYAQNHPLAFIKVIYCIF